MFYFSCMKNFLFLFFFLCFFPVSAFANYEIGNVVKVGKSGENELGTYQILEVEGENHQKVSLDVGDVFKNSASSTFTVGDTLIMQEKNPGEYQFVERYRLPSVFFVAFVFFVFALFLAKKRGFFAILGLIFSFLVIFLFVLPALQNGTSALLVGILASTFIVGGSMVITHGFRLSTFLAVGSTVAVITFAGILAIIATKICWLFGIGSEDTLQLALGEIGNGDFRGIFLVGVLLGTLGVLDDVTTTQVSAVIELKRANVKMDWKELFSRASRIGEEHLVSVINTLVLAYAGASLPLLLLFSSSTIPWWVLLNSEMVAEEVIRTLVGSMALLIAIPFSTFLAAKIMGPKTEKYFQNENPSVGCGHTHIL